MQVAEGEGLSPWVFDLSILCSGFYVWGCYLSYRFTEIERVSRSGRKLTM
jgi:hypothetical protein